MRQSRIKLGPYYYLLVEKDNKFMIKLHENLDIEEDYELNDYFLERCFSSPDSDIDYIYFGINDTDIYAIYKDKTDYVNICTPGEEWRTIVEGERYNCGVFIPYCSIPPK